MDRARNEAAGQQARRDDGDDVDDVDEGGLSDAEANEQATLQSQEWAGGGLWACANEWLGYYPLVRRIASRMVHRLPQNVEIDDLVQAGTLGLHDALMRFDKSLGIPVASYVAIRVRGAMLDELRSHDWVCKSDRRGLRRREEAEQRLAGSLGRRPSDSEMACELGVSLQEHQAFGAQLRQLCFLEDVAPLAPEGEECNEAVDFHAVDETGDPLRILLQADIRRLLHKSIDRLPQREKFVMAMHYLQGHKFVEISAILGVKEPRVSQIHQRAIRRLQVTMNSAI